MAHIVILGAGIGGLPAAYEARQALGKDHRITVINADPYFQFIPSNPWLAVGWRNRDDISFPMAPYLERKDIDFIAQMVTAIHAPDNRLELANGDSVDYDYLIITTGAKLMFSEVEGAGPEHNTQSICTINHAEQSYEDYQRLLNSPGPVVVGAFGGASCYGPAYEYVFILDTALRKKKLRSKVPITFVTPEPYIGHLGLGGVADSNGMLESELRSHDVKWITNAKTTKVEKGIMYVDEYDRSGAVIHQHELPFNHAMMLPAFKGVDCVANVPDLCNPRGFVKIDEYQRSPAYKNIFSAGVAVAIPPVEKTPVPVGAPKTGYMIESMITAIVQNIHAELTGEGKPDYKGTWQAICLADFGDRGAAFVAQPQMPPRNVNWFASGKWVHLAKIAFEKYFIRKMKKGTSEPLYEKYVMQAIGINRLEK